MPTTVPTIEPAARPAGRAISAPVVLQSLVMAFACVVAFGPALDGAWLWDDNSLIVDNPLMRDPSGWWQFWFTPTGPDYYPLTSTVQWISWHIWGDTPMGYHCLNIILHLMSAFLLWRIFSRLGLRLAWFGALLFAIHPLTVESVAWISELKNTLSLPLLLLAIIGWLNFDWRHRLRDYGLAVACFIAALLAKTSVIMLPPVLLLYVWWKRGHITLRDVLATMPFFVSSLLLGLLTIAFQSHGAIGGEPIAAGGFASRMAGAGLAIAFYLGKCILPVALLPIYPAWKLEPPTAWQFLPWFIIVAALAWMWSQRKGWGRHALLGIGFFLLNLVPVLGFVTMSYQRFTLVADHFAYVPMIGVIGVAAAGAGFLFDELSADRRPFVTGALGTLVLLFTWQSRLYDAYFRGPEELWSYAWSRNPAWAVAHNLGVADLEAGKIDEALALIQTSLALDPDNAEAHSDLADALRQKNRLPEAVTEYQEALRRKPWLALTRNNFGLALEKLGRLPEAINQYQAAVQINPRFAAAHNNLGRIYLAQGRMEEAIEEYQQVLQISPDLIETHENLGDLFMKLNRFAEAAEQYQIVVASHPDSAGAYLHLANASADAGKISDAAALYQISLRLQPNSAEVHNNFGLALLRLGRPAEARAQFEDALRWQPDYAEARANLGRLPIGPPAVAPGS